MATNLVDDQYLSHKCFQDYYEIILRFIEFWPSRFQWSGRTSDILARLGCSLGTERMD
jgi:hypothetical protein